MDDLDVEWTNTLGFKLGDLTFMHTRSYRCTLIKDESPLKKRLILTRVDCMDLESYNWKIQEADKFIRFNHHPNITTLYSYWVSEPITNQHYKTLYMLFEEATVGDIYRCLVCNPLKPSKTTVLKYICDLAKGLGMLHQSGVVHGAIRATNLFINEENHLVLGPIKKSETESLRKMYHLISKFNINKYIQNDLIYWAPEVFKGEELTIQSDLWSVGVVIFVLYTGEYPFDIKREDTLVMSIKEANVIWRPLIDHPMIMRLLKNLLVVNPKDRLNINQVLSECQTDFVITIQKIYRSFIKRRHVNLIKDTLIKIQAFVRGWLVRKKYHRKRFEVRWQAAKVIQKKFREFKGDKTLRSLKKLVFFLQAKVLARQIRRSYLKLKKDTITIQSFIRKYLVYTSYHAMNEKRADLAQDMASRSPNIEKFIKLARIYFPAGTGNNMMELKLAKQEKYQRGDRIMEEDEEDDLDVILGK